MSRFTRFSRISPSQLLRRRERTAWCSSGLTGVFLGTTACLLLQQVRVWGVCVLWALLPCVYLPQVCGM